MMPLCILYVLSNVSTIQYHDYDIALYILYVLYQ